MNFRLVNSEANTRRIQMVENCFGSSGQVSEQNCIHFKAFYITLYNYCSLWVFLAVYWLEKVY